MVFVCVASIVFSICVVWYVCHAMCVVWYLMCGTCAVSHIMCAVLCVVCSVFGTMHVLCVEPLTGPLTDLFLCSGLTSHFQNGSVC